MTKDAMIERNEPYCEERAEGSAAASSREPGAVWLKTRVRNYWAKRAEDFQAQRLRELRSPLRDRWYAEMMKYLPMGRELRILDLGTGTGFFAFLLSEKGNFVTGIDLTEEMIRGANELAGILGMPADFRVMDAEAPEFEPESFDSLVTRNLTWTLPHLEKAYRNWYRLLTPGGVLINFDGDYGHAGPQENWKDNLSHRNVTEEMKLESDSITAEVAKSQGIRPLWDTRLLMDAGFERISLDTGVYRRIYREKDEFYNPIPIFVIAAYKPY